MECILPNSIKEYNECKQELPSWQRELLTKVSDVLQKHCFKEKPKGEPAAAAKLCDQREVFLVEVMNKYCCYLSYENVFPVFLFDLV